MKRILRKSMALVLTLALLVGLFPVAGMADDTATPDTPSDATENTLKPAGVEDDNVILSKTAERTGKDTWKVTLKVRPKETLKPVPSEVVLVMDDSESMKEPVTKNGQSKIEALKNVLKGKDDKEGLVDILAAARVKLGAVRFSADTGDARATAFNEGQFYDLNNAKDVEKFKRDVDTTFKLLGGTFLTQGLELAQDIFNTSENAENTRRAVIVLTDGELSEIREGGERKEKLDKTVEDTKKIAPDFYGIFFGNDAHGSATLKSVVGNDANFFTAEDYDGLQQHFEDIVTRILATVSDPMSDYVECTDVTSTEVTDADGTVDKSYPFAKTDGSHVTWSLNDGQTLTPGQTLTITYTVQLKDDALAALYEQGGVTPLNGDAELNYIVEGKNDGTHQKAFPVPTDRLDISQLTTNTYLDGQPYGEPEVNYDIAWENNGMTLTLPEIGATISQNDTTYTYFNSTYDENAVSEDHVMVPVTAGAHTLNHYYYSLAAKGSLIYDANGGTFAAGETALSKEHLLPKLYQLWTKDGQGERPDGQSTWPTHVKKDGRGVAMIGWTEDDNTVEQIYEKNASLPSLATTVNVGSGSTRVYAVWGYDDNGDGIADAAQMVITPETQTIYTGGTDGEGAGDSFPHPIYVKKDDGTTVSDDEVFLVDGKEWQATEENPYPFTVKYYYKTGDNAGQELTDDAHFGDYEARIVPVDGVELANITTKDGAKVNFASGTLRIRYVSNATEASGNELTSEAQFYTDENKNTVRQEVENKAESEPTIILPETTTIYLNGNKAYPYPKENTDAYNISLLFDELLPRTGGGSNQGYIDALIDHAEDKGFDLNGKDTDFKYLDLVDSNNSNAWVSSSQGSEVFWPYPEGTDKNDEFQFLHFKGLHREYSMPGEENINDQINASEVENVKIEKTDAGIWFQVGESGFSPFALIYDKENGGVTPPPVDPGEPGGGDNPPALNTEDHFSYVVGYEDGMVKPQRNITRAEVSSIFYRLLEDEVRDDNTTDVSDFSDVSASDWYGTTVATLSKMGIVKGYEDGTFRPNAPITRAEFAAIATRFFEETGAEYEPGTFTDVSGDEWFAGAIQDAVNLGLIGGYEDGSVRPNNNITRAEACAIVNRTLGRVPDADHLLPTDEMKTWPDNKPSDWFYADMQEATNGHEYEWIKEDGNKVEEWTKIMLDNDWEDR